MGCPVGIVVEVPRRVQCSQKHARRSSWKLRDCFWTPSAGPARLARSDQPSRTPPYRFEDPGSCTSLLQWFYEPWGFRTPRSVTGELFAIGSLLIYVDGSFYQDVQAKARRRAASDIGSGRAGWAQVWYKGPPRADMEVESACGPVIVDQANAAWAGARHHSHVTGELQALAESLLGVLGKLNRRELLASDHVAILSDCRLVVDSVSGTIRPNQNRRSVMLVLIVYAYFGSRLHLQILHVFAHRGLLGNERADELAKLGHSSTGSATTPQRLCVRTRPRYAADQTPTSQPTSPSSQVTTRIHHTIVNYIKSRVLGHQDSQAGGYDVHDDVVDDDVYDYTSRFQQRGHP